MKLARKIKSRKLKVGGPKEYVILDFRDKTLKLPNGDIIRKDDIIHYDPQTNTIVYRAPNGEIRTLTLSNPDNMLELMLAKMSEPSGGTNSIHL